MLSESIKAITAAIESSKHIKDELSITGRFIQQLKHKKINIFDVKDKTVFEFMVQEMAKGQTTLHSDKCRMIDSGSCDINCFKTCSIGRLNKLVAALRKYLDSEYQKTFLHCPIGVKCNNLILMVKHKIKNQGIRPRQAPEMKQDEVFLLICKIARVTQEVKGKNEHFRLLRLLTVVLLCAELGVRLDDVLSLRFENVVISSNCDEIKIHFVKSKNSTLTSHLVHVLQTSESNLAGFVFYNYVRNLYRDVMSRNVFTTSGHKFTQVTRETMVRNLNFFLDPTKKFTFHSFRVSKAHALYRSNMPIKELASFMGWRSIEVAKKYAGA